MNNLRTDTVNFIPKDGTGLALVSMFIMVPEPGSHFVLLQQPAPLLMWDRFVSKSYWLCI